MNIFDSFVIIRRQKTASKFENNDDNIYYVTYKDIQVYALNVQSKLIKQIILHIFLI